MELLVLITIAVLVVYYLNNKPAGPEPISASHLPYSFIVFDLETTGLDAKTEEIIEIGAIKFKKGFTSHETFQALIKPNKKIPKKIIEITGITQAMVDADGEPLVDALKQFNEFIGDLRLVTFNAEFDMAFIRVAYQKEGLGKIYNPVSCALKMARQAWPGRKSYKLESLAADGGFSDGKAHRAIEDAKRALIVYTAAVDRLKYI